MCHGVPLGGGRPGDPTGGDEATTECEREEGGERGEGGQPEVDYRARLPEDLENKINQVRTPAPASMCVCVCALMTTCRAVSAKLWVLFESSVAPGCPTQP